MTVDGVRRTDHLQLSTAQHHQGIDDFQNGGAMRDDDDSCSARFEGEKGALQRGSERGGIQCEANA